MLGVASPGRGEPAAADASLREPLLEHPSPEPRLQRLDSGRAPDKVTKLRAAVERYFAEVQRVERLRKKAQALSKAPKTLLVRVKLFESWLINEDLWLYDMVKLREMWLVDALDALREEQARLGLPREPQHRVEARMVARYRASHPG